MWSRPMAIFFANLHISTVHKPKSNLSVVKLWPRQLDENFELQPIQNLHRKKSNSIIRQASPKQSSYTVGQKSNGKYIFLIINM